MTHGNIIKYMQFVSLKLDFFLNCVQFLQWRALSVILLVLNVQYYSIFHMPIGIVFWLFFTGFSNRNFTGHWPSDQCKTFADWVRQYSPDFVYILLIIHLQAFQGSICSMVGTDVAQKNRDPHRLCCRIILPELSWHSSISTSVRSLKCTLDANM